MQGWEGCNDLVPLQVKPEKDLKEDIKLTSRKLLTGFQVNCDINWYSLECKTSANLWQVLTIDNQKENAEKDHKSEKT